MNFAADKNKIIGGVIVVAVLAAALAMIGWLPSQTSAIYTNRTFGFSVRLPSDYAVTEAPSANPPEENGTADVIEFADQGGSVQLTITYAPYASPQLTEQSLLSNFSSISGIQTQAFPVDQVRQRGSH